MGQNVSNGKTVNGSSTAAGYPTQPPLSHCSPQANSPSHGPIPVLQAQPGISVPVSYYPNNIYGNSGGVLQRVDDALDRFDADLTNALDDSSRFYNNVRDNSVPLPPGHVTSVFYHQSTSAGYVPGGMVAPPTSGHSFPQGESPPSYDDSVYPELDAKEKKMNEVECGMK